MTELIIWRNGSTDDFKLEINDQDIAKTFQINTVGELKDRQANYTKRFKVPKSSNNQKAFEMLGIVGSVTDIPHGLIKAKLVVNGFEIVKSGRLDIIESVKDYYEVTIIDGNNSFFDEIRNKTLGDLDFSALNHTNNITNWINSQTNTSGYIYAYGDFGKDNLSPVNISFQIPSLFIHTLWDMIFGEAGFTYNGSFFSNPDYLSDVINSGYGNSREFVNELTTSSSLNHTEVQFLGAFTREFTLLNYTLTDDLVFVLNVNYNFQELTGGTGTDYHDIYINGILDTSIPVQTISPPYIFNYNKELNTGDTIELRLRTNSRANIVGNQSIDFTYSGVFTQKERQSDFVNFNKLFKNVKQYDFIKDVMQRYGLIFQTNSKDLRFEKFADVINGNFGRVDWSDKFDTRISEKYASGYGKLNTARYKYQNEVTPFADGILEANNIKNDKDLFTSIYTASETKSIVENNGQIISLYQIPVYNDKDNSSNVGIRIFRVNNVNAQTSLEDIFGNTNFYNGLTAVLNFDGLDYQTLLDLHYDSFENKVLDNFKMFTNSTKLNQIDIQNLDFFKLIHISHLGTDFYLNKISNYIDGRTTKTELVKINP